VQRSGTWGISGNKTSSAEQRDWIIASNRIEAASPSLDMDRPDGTDQFIDCHLPINELVG
jgi:hypothetical protein